MQTTAERAPAAVVAALAGFALLQSVDGLAPAALPALVAGAAVALRRGELDFARPAGAAPWAFGALLLAWCAATLLAPQPELGLALSVPPLAAAIVLLLAARARWTPAAHDTLFAALFAAAAAQGAQVLLAVARGAAPGAPAVEAAAVPWLVAPNDLAWAACLLAALPRRLARARSPAARAGFALAAAVVLAATLAAQSRLALACALLALGVPLLARRRGLALLAAFAVPVLALAAWGKGLASLESRAELWAAALALGAEQPWTGVGPGGFTAALEAVSPAATRIDPRGMPWPHSLPLEAFALLGLPGLAALLASGIACLRRADPRDAATLGMIAAAALVAVLEASLLRTWVWFALALLCGLSARTAPTPATDGSR